MFQCACVYHNFFIHSSITDTGCFYILAIINKAAMNREVQVSFQASVFVSFGYFPEGELLDCMLVPVAPSDKESAYQFWRLRRCRFDPWVGKIPWSRKWNPILVFFPGKFHGQRSLAGWSPWAAKCWTWLSDWAYTHINSVFNFFKDSHTVFHSGYSSL